MSRAKVQQVALVLDGGPAQPPFPGGWVLAIFDTIRAFAPAVAARHRLPVSSRTENRIDGGAEITRRTYERIEAHLVAILTFAFPRVAKVNGFAVKYVNEYFRLWGGGAEAGPIWAKVQGFDPQATHVLGRALWRDLLLRLCYLESCERAFAGTNLTSEELNLVAYDSPARIYSDFAREQKQAKFGGYLELAIECGISDKQLYRVRHGQRAPSLNLLQQLRTPADRLLIGIGFIDALTRRLRLERAPLDHEFLPIVEVFFREHRQALAARFESNMRCDTGVKDKFRHFAALGDNLLFHPGFDAMWPKMPTALWRAHLYSLQFARVMDMAQAYLQFSNSESDRPVQKFFEVAEQVSEGCPYRWMTLLKQPNSVMKFPRRKRTR